ncbi:hypothetical protein CBS101457_004221 [Exobasidium rhododendri]|nr:hypothetical protein CBS101457_004221 [Exobasidium rhododendri]
MLRRGSCLKAELHAALSGTSLQRNFCITASNGAKTTENPSSLSSTSRRRLKFDNAKGGPKLTFEHFVLRDKSIKLFRDFLRATRNISNPSARRETVDWLRDEHFEGSTGLKSEYDIPRIRELLMSGNVALKRICGPMELAGALNPKPGSFPKLKGTRPA